MTNMGPRSFLEPLLNGLELVGKRIEDVKIVCYGAGAAGIACRTLVWRWARETKNHRVRLQGRRLLRSYRVHGRAEGPIRPSYVSAHPCGDRGRSRHLSRAFGCRLSQPEMVGAMAESPADLGDGKPRPGDTTGACKGVPARRHDRHRAQDYPNQVNNVFGFPFIFDGALDVGASAINMEMKLAAVRAIAELAQAEQSDVVAAAYGTQDISFGPHYLIPRPFDPRLITTVAPAVAQAAMESGVASRPVPNIEEYRRSLQRFVYTSGTVMQPVFAAAVELGRKRIVYAEGEDDRILRAAQVAVDESLASPILVGRPHVIAQKITALGLRLQPGRDIEILQLRRSGRYRRCCRGLLSKAQAAWLVPRRRRSRDAAQQHSDRRDAALRGQGGRALVRHVRGLC